MDVLVTGGTRFVGRPVVARLLAAGHGVTLFTRGRQPVPAGTRHIQGDRTVESDLAALDGERFDVIIDSSGRTLDDTRRVLAHTGAPRHRLVYVSSAGVYADSVVWPLDEASPIDPASRHAGKAETESWLQAEGIPFTSFRPTYIIGPGNYNPIERWFFDRLLHDRPVPLPGDGQLITQLGDVRDLAEAMTRCLEVEASCNRIYNCSGRQGVTLRGLVAAAAVACGKDPAGVEIRSFDPASLEPKARKAFPLRLSHFLTDTHRLQRELAWQPMGIRQEMG
jgi:nucleoside-diphosphate-sugar epimerase